MSKHTRFLSVVALIALLGVLVSGCATPTPTPLPAPTKSQAAPARHQRPGCAAANQGPGSHKAPTPTAAPAPQGPVTLWTQLNTDAPGSARDKVFAELLPKLSTAAGVPVKNVNQPSDQLDAKLNLAVQSKGQQPDVFELNTAHFAFHVANGNVQDITAWAKSLQLYTQMPQSVWANCTAPDGKIYCVPAMLRNNITFYYTEAYPKGMPATTDEFLTVAAEVKKTGIFPLSIKISEVWGAQYTLFPLVKSFGGNLADKNGKIVWASPETVKLVELAAPVTCPGIRPRGDDRSRLRPTDILHERHCRRLRRRFVVLWFPGPAQDPKRQEVRHGRAIYAEHGERGCDQGGPADRRARRETGGILTPRTWSIPVGAKNVEGPRLSSPP